MEKRTLSLQPPAQFDVETDGGSTNASRWTTWLRSFKTYLKAANIDNDEQQVALLLHAAGETVEEIFELKKGTATKFYDVISGNFEITGNFWLSS